MLLNFFLSFFFFVPLLYLMKQGPTGPDRGQQSHGLRGKTQRRRSSGRILGGFCELSLWQNVATKRHRCHRSPPVAGMQLCGDGRGVKLKWDTQHLARMIDHVTSGQSEPAEDCGRRKTLINDSGGHRRHE